MSVRLPYQTTLLSLCAIILSVTMNGCSSKQQNISNKTDATQLNSPSGVVDDKAIPKYEHIFVIVEENKAYKEIIGSPNAPNINQLAKTYGLASNFYGEVHPSEANYIAMLAGSTFGIHDDDAYYCQPNQADRFCSNSKLPDYANHTVSSKSLLDQLEQKGLTWKGYFESIAAPGSKAVVYPNVIRALYASKHNGFISLKKVQDDPNELKKIVGLDQLTADLKSGNVPNYSHIILNQCHEMHGLPECFGSSGLIRTGDAWTGRVVKQITSSSMWNSPGNSAIIITWDEDNNPRNKTETQGCCGFDPKSHANFGGGQIPTVVITNHGPRGVVDNTPYNHYSLLRTTEDAFGITEYLNEAGNTNNGVKPMTPLFATKPK
jgi:hypothetical protein